MNIRLATTLFLILIFSMLIFAQGNDLKPILISPGEQGNTTVVEQSTPTFSWTSVPWATEYKIVVFKSDSNSSVSYEEISSTETPIIIKEIRGQATSWTPSSIQRLETGSNYTWYVQAIDINGTGTWSKGGRFKVEIPVVLTGIEEKLREKLKEQGVTDETLDKVFNDLKTEIKEVIVVDKSKTAGSNDLSGVLGSEGDTAYNTFYGTSAGNSLVDTDVGSGTGSSNSFFGYQAGTATTYGDFNTFSGNYAGSYNTTGSYNTFSGSSAGRYTTTAHYNTFFGLSAGRSTSTGWFNTFAGSEAGSNNTTGEFNTFFGQNTGKSTITGNNNSFFGAGAGYTNTTGSGNLFLGYRAGFDETGSNKLYIETDYDTYRTTPLIYGEFDNRIVNINGKLGIGTTTPAWPLEVVTTGSNAKIVINRTDGATGHFVVKTGFATFGTASNHPLRMNVNNIPKVFLLPNGNFGLGVQTPLHPLHLSSGAHCTSSGVWQNASSRELKENINVISSEQAFDALDELNPVTYNYKLEKDELYAGFIAEDVPEMVASKGRKSLGTMDIVAVLTKVVKEQQKEIKKQKEIISDLIKRMEKVEKK